MGGSRESCSKISLFKRTFIGSEMFEVHPSLHSNTQWRCVFRSQKSCLHFVQSLVIKNYRGYTTLSITTPLPLVPQSISSQTRLAVSCKPLDVKRRYMIFINILKVSRNPIMRTFNRTDVLQYDGNKRSTRFQGTVRRRFDKQTIQRVILFLFVLLS